MQNEKIPLESNANHLPSPPFFRAKSWGGRASTAVILVMLATAGFMLYQHLGKTAPAPAHQNDLYMPVVDPVLEPDRPDLIGDSLSDEYMH